jgi:hypothetical protein
MSKRQAKRVRAKFRVGQVVRHRIAGGFYSKILRYRDDTIPRYYVMEQGTIHCYRAEQLRSLTRRERIVRKHGG